jgi:vacuolar-type H+-ATPase subunit F/Vma7
MDFAVVADELTAVGWRLAGARVWIADEHDAHECLLTAMRSAEVVLITAELAARVPSATLQELLRRQPPLLVIIPDVRHRQEPSDIENETRRALGVAM